VHQVWPGNNVSMFFISALVQTHLYFLALRIEIQERRRQSSLSVRCTGR
jgi:hypothetical protein